jgi:pyruvate ferredoxin oxidoreductase gamma subunit/2-oxoisovalerate ferredoxin oxidoreductase gamma subunit
MLEIRIHGRGGQGAVVASKVLASAFFSAGKFVQVFPEFGVERRGAPVTAYARVDDDLINLRCRIYEPDHIIVLDHTLMPVVDVTEGLKAGGWALINSELPPDEIEAPEQFSVACVDATRIALKYGLGTRASPIVNTSIVGAFARITGLVNMDSVSKAIEEEVPFKQSLNVKAAKEAFESVFVRGKSEG